jgi:phage terminase large subunit-like protein
LGAVAAAVEMEERRGGANILGGKIRGAARSQFSAAWLDELAKWRHADETAAINGWRSPREPLDAFASFAGFES